MGFSRREPLKRAGFVGAAAAAVSSRAPASPVNDPAPTFTPQAGAPRREALETLTAAEAATLEAIVARMIPTDDLGPGAAEARAAHYIDRALGGALAASRDAYRSGLAAVDAYARGVQRRRRSTELPAARIRTRCLTDMEIERRDRLYAGRRRHSSIWSARIPSRARSAIPTTAATRISSDGI